MTTGPACRPRRSARAALLATSAGVLAALAAGGANACPLGSHDSPRVRLLHALQKREQHGGHRHLAQAPRQPEQSQQHQAHQPAPVAPPARTEIGAYARDLPRGAAAPTVETRPALFDTLGRFCAARRHREPAGAGVLRPGPSARLGLQPRRGGARLPRRAGARPVLRDVLLGRGVGARPAHQLPDGRGRHPRACAALAAGAALGAERPDIDAALIEALAAALLGRRNADRKALDQAYADAMRAVQARFPEDAGDRGAATPTR